MKMRGLAASVDKQAIESTLMHDGFVLQYDTRHRIDGCHGRKARSWRAASGSLTITRWSGGSKTPSPRTATSRGFSIQMTLNVPEPRYLPSVRIAVRSKRARAHARALAWGRVRSTG